MRERLDCAVLLTRCTVEWVAPFLGQHAGGRLHLHALDSAVDITNEGASAVLGGSAMVLRRYDACLLPVWPASLSWARMSLSQGISRLRTPVIALARELTTAGLYDLHELGMADFVRDPFCGHEARMRIERLLDGQRVRGLVPGGAHHVAEAAVDRSRYNDDPILKQVCANILEHDGPELEAYATAAALRCSTSRESFGESKRKVVDCFERAYITAALSRHGGNIAMAARSSQKHRRAFWALMRKHDIDAEPFRAKAASMVHTHRDCAASSKTPRLPYHVARVGFNGSRTAARGGRAP